MIEIKGATLVFPENNFEPIKKSLFISNGKVLKTAAGTGKIKTVIHAENCVVMPSFINAHQHFYSYFAKCLPAKPASNFLQVLKNLWWKLDSVITDNEVLASTAYSIEESIKNGVSCVFDHHVSKNTSIGILNKMNAIFQHYSISGNSCFELTNRYGQQYFDYALFENKNNPLSGLHASFTLSDKNLKKIAAQNKPIHVHITEDLVDDEISKQKYGFTALSRFLQHGLITNNSILVHGCYLNPKQQLQLKGKFLALAVESNLNNGVKPANPVQMLENEIKLVAGTDGMHSNILKAIKSIFLYSQSIGNSAKNNFNLVKNLLINSYKLKQLYNYQGGSKQNEFADLTIIDYPLASKLTSQNFWANFVYGICEQQVKWLIKGSKILLHNGNLCMPKLKFYYDINDLTNRFLKHME